VQNLLQARTLSVTWDHSMDHIMCQSTPHPLSIALQAASQTLFLTTWALPQRLSSLDSSAPLLLLQDMQTLQSQRLVQPPDCMHWYRRALKAVHPVSVVAHATFPTRD
jgi:hypothetical protein